MTSGIQTSDGGLIPKRLWTLWVQGLDAAPPVVRACVDSWRHWNPQWQFEILDEPRVFELLPDLRDWRDRWPGMTATSFSDLIRVNLLSRFGGVWTDATCLCRRPLDVWLPGLARQGFFAFVNPATDRLLASWFLAARPGAPLIQRWAAVSNDYWRHGAERVLVDMDDLLKAPEHAEYRGNRLAWFDPDDPRYRTHYPYFWFHYLFEGLVAKPDLIASWQSMPKMTADIPHRLQQAGLRRPVDEPLRQEFRLGIAPLYKLTYKHDVDPDDRERLFGYCLDPRNW